MDEHAEEQGDDAPFGAGPQEHGKQQSEKCTAYQLQPKGYGFGMTSQQNKGPERRQCRSTQPQHTPAVAADGLERSLEGGIRLCWGSGCSQSEGVRRAG